MADITYCINSQCPFDDCERHLSKLHEIENGKYVSVANLDGVCRRYISNLVEEAERALTAARDMPTCNDCKANKVCDHNKYGFENCGNYISADVVEVEKAKAVKEFAERLFERTAVTIFENKSEEYKDGFYDCIIRYNEEVDNLLEEMVGERE